MKIFVKSLKGNHFQIEVQPKHTVSDVKKNIESVQGANVFPASQQMLIYQGRALSDGTTLEENKVAENSFIVVMLCKSKNSSRESSVAAAAIPTSKSKNSSRESSVAAAATPTSKTKKSSGDSTVAIAAMAIPKSTGESSVEAAAVPISKSESSPRESSVAETAMPTSKRKSSAAKSPVAAAAMPMPKNKVVQWKQPLCTSMAPATPESPVEAPTTPPTTVNNASVPASMHTPESVPVNASSASESDIGSQVASNHGTRNGLENTIQQILDMGGGLWDRDTVLRALHAASNDPEMAVEFLYTSVPERVEAGQPSNPTAVSQLPTRSATVSSSRPNADPLRGLSRLGSNAGPLDFLRHSDQFQALRAMVQANPQILQPMLQEFGKQNPNLMRLIREHQTDFHRLLNEPLQGEGNILEQFAGAVPQAIQVTPEEHASIERLEAMGFDRSTALEAYFACNKNEGLAANYLLDHMHEF